MNDLSLVFMTEHMKRIKDLLEPKKPDLVDMIRKEFKKIAKKERK